MWTFVAMMSVGIFAIWDYLKDIVSFVDENNEIFCKTCFLYAIIRLMAFIACLGIAAYIMIDINNIATKNLAGLVVIFIYSAYLALCIKPDRGYLKPTF